MVEDRLLRRVRLRIGHDRIACVAAISLFGELNSAI